MIKVVWICSVSNEQLRNHINLYIPTWRRVQQFLKYGTFIFHTTDSAIWNSKAIKEFETMPDVDLHVIFVHPMLRRKVQFFKEAGISYYAVSIGDNSFIDTFRNINKAKPPRFNSTWLRISALINEIKPDIVHLMGAENPTYSPSVLLLPKSIPIIVQLQTLLHNPEVKRASLKHQKECELAVLKRADYIGTDSPLYPPLIREHIKQDAICIRTGLIVAEKEDHLELPKEYDFAYWANNLHKGIDQVIEAFALASMHTPNLSLDVIGGASSTELSIIENRLTSLGIREKVRFEGRLPTHDDVLRQIKKARFALLPLRSDIIPSTIREAMWNGLPVITTITQGTPELNKNRETVLLSKVDDYESLASNMLLIKGDEMLALRLKTNGYITVEEEFGNNSARAKEWVQAYYACINHFYNGNPLSNSIVNKN